MYRGEHMVDGDLLILRHNPLQSVPSQYRVILREKILHAGSRVSVLHIGTEFFGDDLVKLGKGHDFFRFLRA